MEKPASVDEIIKLASENNGWIGYSICYNKKQMSKIEFEDAIQKMLLGVMNSILLKVKLRMIMLFIDFL